MGAWYFRHDYGARNDQKLIELDMELGAHIGYALWFQLLEVMGEMDGRLLSRENCVLRSVCISSLR